MVSQIRNASKMLNQNSRVNEMLEERFNEMLEKHLRLGREASRDLKRVRKAIDRLENDFYVPNVPFFELEGNVATIFKFYGRALSAYKLMKKFNKEWKEEFNLYERFTPLTKDRLKAFFVVKSEIRETLSSLGEKVGSYKDKIEESKERDVVVARYQKQVSEAKGDKELEALAVEIGALQSQPEYAKEYERILDSLQARIEEKYSVVGKGLRYIKRLFNKGRRASQIRTASEMINQINKEIADLKKDL